jgi:hypothetical protein
VTGSLSEILRAFVPFAIVLKRSSLSSGLLFQRDLASLCALRHCVQWIELVQCTASRSKALGQYPTAATTNTTKTQHNNNDNTNNDNTNNDKNTTRRRNTNKENETQQQQPTTTTNNQQQQQQQKGQQPATRPAAKATTAKTTATTTPLPCARVPGIAHLMSANANVLY